MAKDVIARLKADTSQWDNKIKGAKTVLSDLGAGGKQAGQAIGQFDKIMGTSIGTLGKLTAGVGAVSAALKVAKDAFMQTESNIDAWGTVVKQGDAAYKTFLDTLNSGNWSNFFKNLNDAIQGAADLYGKLDRLGSIKSNNAAAIAIKEQALQELRLKQKQGEKVDSEIAKLNKEIAALKNQSIVTGKDAGQTQINEIIKRRYQALGGKGMSDDSLNKVSKNILNSGQSYFDMQAKILGDLSKKYTRTGKQSRANSYGGTSTIDVSYIDEMAMSATERAQYRLAKAITEGETEIQSGIATYADATREAAGNIRQEVRYTGASGKGGKSGKTAVQKVEKIPELKENEKIAFSFVVDDAELAKLKEKMPADATIKETVKVDDAELAKLKEKMPADATIKETVKVDDAELAKLKDGRTEVVITADTQEASAEIDKLIAESKAKISGLEKYLVIEPKIAGVDFDWTQSIAGIEKQIQYYNKMYKEAGTQAGRDYAKSMVAQLKMDLENLEPDVKEAFSKMIPEKLDLPEIEMPENIAEEGKDISKSWGQAASIIGSVGSALNSIENPTAKVAGIIAETIATIASAYGQALASDKSTKSNIWAFIAASAASVVSMATTINAVKSNARYASGGEIKGTSWSGDNLALPGAYVNAGEYVFNRAQLGNLAGQLQNGGLNNMKLEASVKAEQISIALLNRNKRTGRGETVSLG